MIAENHQERFFMGSDLQESPDKTHSEAKTNKTTFC
jgi:hypothetical protein